MLCSLFVSFGYFLSLVSALVTHGWRWLAPSPLHKEKDEVPNRTARDEAGQGMLLMLKY